MLKTNTYFSSSVTSMQTQALDTSYTLITLASMGKVTLNQVVNISWSILKKTILYLTTHYCITSSVIELPVPLQSVSIHILDLMEQYVEILIETRQTIASLQNLYSHRTLFLGSRSHGNLSTTTDHKLVEIKQKLTLSVGDWI